MKKIVVMLCLVGFCIVGCSSNQEEEKHAPVRTTSHEVVSAATAAAAAKTPRQEKRQLHREQNEKAGAEYDENGNMKEGSLARILESGGK